MKGELEKDRTHAGRRRMEEPLRGLVHGLPWTGRSKVILFIRRFFEEALGWTYGEEFIFVAFQNHVAHAMMRPNHPQRRKPGREISKTCSGSRFKVYSRSTQGLFLT